MRLLLVFIGLIIGAIGGIWLSAGMFLGAGISFGFGCWAYLQTRGDNGRRPDLEDLGTWLVLGAIGLGVAASHVLLYVAAYAVAQR